MVLGTSFIVLLVLIGLMAFLYASVGHGGASGYLAVMALFAVSPSLMKQSALVLNLSVSLFAFYSFYKGGYFRWRNFWPFAVTSIPMAYIGAKWPISDATYKQILAMCLILSVFRIMFKWNEKVEGKQVPLLFGLLVGGGIGLLSGMIGIGGGIILSPLMLLFGWGTVKETAAVSALFIFVNSIAGLLGIPKWEIFQAYQLPILVVVATIAGMLGARWGSNKASIFWLKVVLAIVLLVASGKLMWV